MFHHVFVPSGLQEGLQWFHQVTHSDTRICYLSRFGFTQSSRPVLRIEIELKLFTLTLLRLSHTKNIADRKEYINRKHFNRKVHIHPKTIPQGLSHSLSRFAGKIMRSLKYLSGSLQTHLSKVSLKYLSKKHHITYAAPLTQLCLKTSSNISLSKVSLKYLS